MGASTEHDGTQIWVQRGADRLAVQLYPEPPVDSSPDLPLVVLWCAMGVPASYYRPLAERLRELGLRVAIVDLRGTGASEPLPSRRSRYGYAELTEDVGAVLDQLVPVPSDGPVVLLGHSLGGQACLLYMATTDDKRVSGLAMVAAGLPYWKVYQGWKRVVAFPFTQTIGATSALLGVWPGWGFGGRQSNGVIRDWAYTGRAGRFPDLNGSDIMSALRNVRTPILALSVDHDQYTPPSTTDYLCRMLESAPVEREHYTAEMTGATLDHFRWARKPGPIAERIVSFVTSVPMT